MPQNPVTEIALPPAVFEDAVFRPAAVNLIYGRNGTGKSTLAAACRDRSALRFGTAEGAEIAVFDSRYIAQNVRQYANMPGIVTVSASDSAVTKQIATWQSRRRQSEIWLRELDAEIAALRTQQTALEAAFADRVFRKTASLRQRYEAALRGCDTAERFGKAMRFTMPHACDAAELNRVYRAAFGERHAVAALLAPVPDPAALDNLAALALLHTPPLDAPDSDFLRHMNRIGAADWVQEGVLRFPDDCCPYCQQALPAEVMAQLAALAAGGYAEMQAHAEQLLADYRRAANRLYLPLQRNLRSCPPDVDSARYAEHLALLRQLIRENLERIAQKRRRPAETVLLTPLCDLLGIINGDISRINAQLHERNLYVTARREKQAEARRRILGSIAYRLREDIEALNRALRDTAPNLPDLEREAEKQRAAITDADAQIHALQETVSESKSAIDRINALLLEAGSTGFTLRQSGRHTHAYAVVRSNGEAASRLSEGEQRLLAFLYFYVCAEQPAPQGKVLVLDDPFTALDSTAAETVLRLTRELMLQCVTAPAEERRQMLVLTCREQYFGELRLALPEGADSAVCTLQKSEGKSCILPPGG